MAKKNLVTQGELNATIAGLGALADNLSQHVEASLSKAHGWSIIDSAYLDSGGNYHTDFGNQASLVDIPGLYNTGVNNDGTLASPGTNDLHWTLIQSADKKYPGPDLPILTPLPGSYASNGPNSQYIGPRVSGAVNSGTYKYRISFDLTGLNPTSAIIRGVWSSDNATNDIYLNGVSTGYNSSTTISKQPASQFSLSGPFLAGVNTLDFIVRNGDGPCSLRVEFTTAKASVGGVFAVPGLFSTGVDDNGVVLPTGSIDPHWILAQSADSSNPGPNAYLFELRSSYGYAPNSTTSAWISSRASGSIPAGNYLYQISFDLTGFNPATVLLKGQFWSNDVVLDAYINGASLGITNTNSGKKYPTSFVVSHGFQAGANTLGFLVTTNHQDSGFRAEVTGTGAHSGDMLTSRVLRLTVGGNVFYVPAQASGGLDGTPDPSIPSFTGIVSPQSADPASDVTVGSPTSARLVTSFADLLNAISNSASSALLEHAGSSAESVHGGLTWQADQIFTSGAYLVGRRSINILINGVPYKIVADTNLSGPLNS